MPITPFIYCESIKKKLTLCFYGDLVYKGSALRLPVPDRDDEGVEGEEAPGGEGGVQPAPLPVQVVPLHQRKFRVFSNTRGPIVQ